MDKHEAGVILDAHLESIRSLPYSDLILLIEKNASQNSVLIGPSGTKYYVEVQAFWDDRPGGNVRILGSIDDGGIRAFAPLTRDFIKCSDGSFV